MSSNRLRVGASYGAFSSTLVFGDQFADIGEQAVLTTLQYRATDRWTLQASAGAILVGALATANTAYRMRPGWLFGVAASFRVLDGAGWLPFVMVSGSLSASGTALEDGASPGSGFHSTLTSIDISGVVTVGKTLFRVLSPYVMARVFGGPVLWQQNDSLRLGTDIFHYQIGFGLAVAVLRRFDAFVEGAPLGERRISAGMGVSF